MQITGYYVNPSHVVHSNMNNVSKIVRPWVYTRITIFDVRSGFGFGYFNRQSPRFIFWSEYSSLRRLFAHTDNVTVHLK